MDDGLGLDLGSAAIFLRILVLSVVSARRSPSMKRGGEISRSALRVPIAWDTATHDGLCLSTSFMSKASSSLDQGPYNRSPSATRRRIRQSLVSTHLLQSAGHLIQISFTTVFIASTGEVTGNFFPVHGVPFPRGGWIVKSPHQPIWFHHQGGGAGVPGSSPAAWASKPSRSILSSCDVHLLLYFMIYLDLTKRKMRKKGNHRAYWSYLNCIKVVIGFRARRVGG